MNVFPLFRFSSLTITLILLAMLLNIVLTGCAEGPIWRTGYLSPWARKKWAEEEQVVQTLFAKRQRLRQIVDHANEAGDAQRAEASQFLADVVQKDPVLLLRIEATKLLAELPTETATRALQLASKDPEPDVRLAAITAWEFRRDDVALNVLTSMLNEDEDFDVRLRAADALGAFSQEESARRLAGMLADANPAMQIKVAESLAKVTGEDFGTDIQAWQSYVTNRFGREASQTASTTQNHFK